MPKGGARVSSGPPPNPNSRRQQGRVGDWTLLPVEGRAGRAPTWPLAVASGREREVWRQIWRTPQAVAWERLGWTFDVAMYVRHLVTAADAGLDPTVALRAAAEARQWSDRLGLSPAAMLRNRWRIASDEVAAKREAAASPAPRRLIGGGGGAVAGA